MDIQITKSQLRLLCGGLIGLASLVMQACDMEQDKDVRESICGNWESVESKPDLLIYKEGNVQGDRIQTQRHKPQAEAGNLSAADGRQRKPVYEYRIPHRCGVQ